MHATTPDEWLARFAGEHALSPVEGAEVDDLLPRSCQVADAHQLHVRGSNRGWRWVAYRGALPGGIEGTIAHVHLWDQATEEDVFDIVRAPLAGATLVDTLEIQGPVRGDLRAYGGHRMSDVPFPAGTYRPVKLDGVPRRFRVRVPRSADPSAVDRVLDPGFVTWLGTEDPPFCFELYDGWLSVFRTEQRPEPEADLYPGLCDAAARFAAACRGPAPT